MAQSFAALKKSRSSSLSKLVTETSKINAPAEGSSEDNRFWKPTVDKAGNGYAVIRFLPEPKGEDLPWVRTFSHGFQGPSGKWYIENSLTTFNEKDPVSEYNSTLWNNGTEAGKEQARKQKRRLSYIANIFVVKDPSNPENEGTVRLYKFGKKIFDKLNEKMNPEFEDETATNPFDFWEGCDLKLKIRNVEGYRNYDKSEFAEVSPLENGDDDKLEKVYESMFSLNEFLDRKHFKTYAELQAKLNMVLGLEGASTVAPSVKTAEENVVEMPKQKEVSAPKIESSSNDDDENLSFFEKLAEDE
jgi:hypothetical protein|tara:strand:+ start:519 stop:1424 length:906 start_codon:yes stop_codon:yes gene_type:complete